MTPKQELLEAANSAAIRLLNSSLFRPLELARTGKRLAATIAAFEAQEKKDG